MEAFWITTGVAAFSCAAVLLIAYVCYRMAFYEPNDREVPILPEGEIYEAYREPITRWASEVRAMPRQEFHITSFDGLELWGNYYEYAPGATIELMFHGYRGSAERDLSGGVQRCFKLGRNALIVDQRCSGRSGGNTITFGIKEHRDCLAWVDFTVKHFGPDVKIILTGISMGAATVMMAAGEELPKNVIGILADCGYSSPKEIIKTVIRQMGLPANLLYPFVKLGARLYGKFDLEENSPVEAMRKCTLPVIFFHGEADDYVPCQMSRINYEACASRKKLVTVPGAGHGLSYPADPERYLKELDAFFSREDPEKMDEFGTLL